MACEGSARHPRCSPLYILPVARRPKAPIRVGRAGPIPSGAYPLTPEEQEKIEAVKEAHPYLRHRQIQGVL